MHLHFLACRPILLVASYQHSLKPLIYNLAKLCIIYLLLFLFNFQSSFSGPSVTTDILETFPYDVALAQYKICSRFSESAPKINERQKSYLHHFSWRSVPSQYASSFYNVKVDRKPTELVFLVFISIAKEKTARPGTCSEVSSHCLSGYHSFSHTLCPIIVGCCLSKDPTRRLKCFS